jgi:hypothetical protein
MMLVHQFIYQSMRTTLDIDDDILLAAKERATRERKSLGAVVSALAREALQGPAPRVRGGGSAPMGECVVLPRRNEVVTLEKVRALQDQEGV